jgi:hypothetical protein
LQPTTTVFFGVFQEAKDDLRWLHTSGPCIAGKICQRSNWDAYPSSVTSCCMIERLTINYVEGPVFHDMDHGCFFMINSLTWLLEGKVLAMPTYK